MNQARILLVEDDQLLQKFYTDLLVAENYYVETASDGLSAYDKIKLGDWDLILLDVFLPDLNGIEIVKKLKSESLSPANKKIVFLTNVDQGSDFEEIKKLGVDYLIKSSLNPDQLILRIKSYLMN